MRSMTNLIINVNWEYFLGIVGTLIGLAYYANGRFTKLETSVEWLKDAVRDMALSASRVRPRSSKTPAPLQRGPQR